MSESTSPATPLRWDVASQPLLASLVPLLQARAAPVYLVGGVVRDILLADLAAKPGQLHDLDFATAGDGLAVARAFARALDGAFYALDEARGTGRVVLDREPGPPVFLDVATFRGDGLAADLAGRDFTVNAMALDLSTTPPLLHDPLGGRADLNARLIRATSPRALADDPVRMLRAVRQTAELGFALEARTETLVRQGASSLLGVSPERIRDELIKMMRGPWAARAVADLERLGLLALVLPEVADLAGETQGPPHYLPVFEHSLATLGNWPLAALAMLEAKTGSLVEPVETYLATRLDDGTSYRTLIALAALLHDTGKPSTRSVDQEGRIRFHGHAALGARLSRARLGRLRFSGMAVSFIGQIVAEHLRPLMLANSGGPGRRAVYRYYRATGEAGVGVALLALADHLATYPERQGQAEGQVLASVVATLCQAFFSRQEVVKPVPLLSGGELMSSFGLDEGPLIGRLLAELAEAQAAGEITDRTQALAFLTLHLAGRQNG